MAYVDNRVKELREKGIFCADNVEKGTISHIVNMDELDYYAIDIMTLESYLGLLAQQAMYVQQEVNIAEAREIELGNIFKFEALPLVIDSKIRSVEERYIFASTLTDGLKLKFDLWQQATIDAILKKKLSDPIVEKLNVLKKIYDDRRSEGKNKYNHKYVDGK